MSDNKFLYVRRGEEINGVHASQDLTAIFEYTPFMHWIDVSVANDLHIKASGPIVVILKDVNIGGSCSVEPKGDAILIIGPGCDIKGEINGWTLVAYSFS